jgi:DNA gyrase subunit B
MALDPLTPAQLEDAVQLRRWADQFQQHLTAKAEGSAKYRVHIQPAVDAVEPHLLVMREHHGTATTKTLPAGFFRSPEYARLSAIGSELRGLLTPAGYVERGKERHDVDTFAAAIDWLMAQAKQGQSIQRYKGLGEMNPEQLWETTVNPETRRLMQVRIEDAVAADEIFTTLMGDQVEPRREFIERNALAVANLDV